MKIGFDIRKQLGFARMGKLTFGNRQFTIPNLLIPVNRSIIKVFEEDMSGIFNERSNYIRGKDGLVGYEIHDPLGLFEENNASGLPGFTKGSKEIQAETFEVPTFLVYKDLFGVNKSELVKTLQADIHTPILSENFPIVQIDRYAQYCNEALLMRLQYYEDLVFPTIEGQKVIIEFHFSSSISRLDIIENWLQRNKKFICGLKITNIFADLMQFNDIMSWILRLKQNTPYDWLWIASGLILPEHFGIAVMLGFDLIDTANILYMGQKGLYLTNSDRYWIRELRFPPCACGACGQLAPDLLEGKKETYAHRLLVLMHDIFISIQEVQRIRQYLIDESFRSYVENQIHANTYLASFLRNFDKNYSLLVQSRYPLISAASVKCVGVESYNRPEIQNFIQRVKTHITPAKEYSAVVVLPCSAKKPYSQSKSHQMFQKAIRRGAGTNYRQFHQIIITSPLGLIPRELEKVFPAAHYDIPVTGDWDDTEIKTTAECLAHWLCKYQNKNKPLHVIAHLAGGYRKACMAAAVQLVEKFPNIASTIVFHYTIPGDVTYSATNNSALIGLQEIVQQVSESFPSVNKENPVNSITEDELIIRAAFDYQFGSGSGDVVIQNGAKLVRDRFPQYDEVLTFDGTGKILVGRIYNNSGLVRLTPQGGQFLSNCLKSKVIITEKELKGTTVFRPIFQDIDPNVHPNDDVLVFNNEGNYLGVGELMVSPEDAKRMEKGPICRIRKKVG